MSDANCVLANRYRLDGRIAAGGAGEVWRAEDLVLGRPVAVKRLHAEYAGHQETLARFRSEARHAASLSHPGIARVYDYEETSADDPPFLVMEFVAGPSLAEVLARGPLPAARVMDLVAQAAAGLDAAHRAGLVHRDIKPANLLLTPAGQVKITDFGIAHAAGSAPVTRHGALIGTPAYLAPERVAGHRATAASDIYSLGILAHECLTGTRPYAGTAIETALAHGQQALPALPSSVPAPVARLVSEMAAKDPAARPISAAVVAARAAILRDDLLADGRQAGQPAWNGHGPDAPVPRSAGQADDHGHTLADLHPLTLTDIGPAAANIGPAAAGGYRALRPGPASHRGGWTGRKVALAVAVSSVAAGLLGWLFSSVIGTAGPASPAAGAPAGSHSSASLVTITPSAFVGQRVGVVVSELTRLGLRPGVHWVHGHHHEFPPGTVIAVTPAGQLARGTAVIVTAVRARGFDHHGQGGDGGHGGDGGNGNGNGG